MTEISRDETYIYLIEEFGETKFEDRFLFLYKLAETFINNRDIQSIVSISISVLYNITVDYFADISRIKQFHPIERVNSLKIASYLAYWVYKRKPININVTLTKDQIKNKPYLDSINEWFCAFIIISIIYDMKKKIEHGIGDYTRFHEFIKLLVYNLTYRVVTSQSIELALTGVEAKLGFEKNETAMFD